MVVDAARGEVTAESVGREVIGPIIAEFCLRLWSLGALWERPDDAAMLFCARGGLRMQLAYERFLAATGLQRPVAVAPLMVSRLAAARPAIARGMAECGALGPATAATLSYEFRRSSLGEVALAITDATPASAAARWDAPFSPEGFVELLRHADGEPVTAALREQADLFTRHLRDAAGGRGDVILVDTGLYGTTRALVAEGLPDLEVSSALIARSYRPGPRFERTFGLSVQADGYSPLRRRTSLLRYWHFTEWLFEPDLPSVRTFREVGGRVVSNLEVEGWRDRLDPDPDSAFAGVLTYLDGLEKSAVPGVVREAELAWRAFHRAVVWPSRDLGYALQVGRRSSDFGLEATWTARPWRGPVAALRGTSMWREGEIARSGTPLRAPLLAMIESVYSARRLKRALIRSDI